MLPCVRQGPHDPDLRRPSIRTPTVRQKRCIRAQLSASSLQKILTEQGMLEIDPFSRTICGFQQVALDAAPGENRVAIR
jgi:hypothetical protein